MENKSVLIYSVAFCLLAACGQANDSAKSGDQAKNEPESPKSIAGTTKADGNIVSEKAEDAVRDEGSEIQPKTCSYFAGRLLCPDWENKKIDLGREFAKRANEEFGGGSPAANAQRQNELDRASEEQARQKAAHEDYNRRWSQCVSHFKQNVVYCGDFNAIQTSPYELPPKSTCGGKCWNVIDGYCDMSTGEEFFTEWQPTKKWPDLYCKDNIDRFR